MSAFQAAGMSVSQLFSMSPWRTVHDINVTTRGHRRFVIDIYCDDQKHDDQKPYETTVTVYEIGKSSGWVFNIRTVAVFPEGHFKAALEWTLNYLKQVDPTDAIAELHNPCNCPFIPESDQHAIALGLGIRVPIRIN